MAVERKSKNRRKLNELQEKPTKEEYAVAKFLRFNAPVREGRLVGMTVQCFFANKAVDALLESKWSASKQKKEPLFTNRASCVSYCNRLLQKGLFHRAEKVQRSKDRDKSKKKKKLKDGEKEEESTEETLRERKKKDKKGKKDGETEKADEEEKEETEKKEEKKEVEKKPEKEEEKKKKEKKLRLNMHDDQWFVDGDEVYVWIYDPVPLKTFLIGLLMVFGAIALCLFPLWPEEVRVGVYYLSLAAAGFVGFILVLVVVRLVLFCIVWIFTLGKHHFWFLPNLTEDVGFFDSFKPLYKHDCGDTLDKTKDKKEKQVKEKEKDKEIEKDNGAKGDGENDGKKEEIEKDENSGSDKSENGEFEIVEKDELTEEGIDEEEVEGENEEEMDEENVDDENDFEEDESDDNLEEKKDK